MGCRAPRAGQQRLKRLLVLTVFLAVLQPFPAQAACDRYFPKPKGDMTAMFQGVIDAAPDGSTICFPGDFTYSVESLKVENRTGLSIQGPSTLKASSVLGDQDPGPKVTWRKHLSIISSANIAIADLRVEGAATGCIYSPNTEGEAGVFVQGSSGVSLLRNSIKNVAGDGIEMASLSSCCGPNATNVVAEANTIDCTGRQGIALTGADHVTIRANTLDRIGRSAFDLEPNVPTQSVFAVTITGNTVGAHGGLFVAGGGNLDALKDDVYVADNLSAVPIRVKYAGTELVWERNEGLGTSEVNVNGTATIFYP